MCIYIYIQEAFLVVDKTILVEDLAGDARNDCIFTNKDVILASPDGMYLWTAKAKSPIYKYIYVKE